jgi:hypothetical protein
MNFPLPLKTADRKIPLALPSERLSAPPNQRQNSVLALLAWIHGQQPRNRPPDLILFQHRVLVWCMSTRIRHLNGASYVRVTDDFGDQTL